MVAQAREALRLAQARYDNALGSIVELNQAQLNETSARDCRGLGQVRLSQPTRGARTLRSGGCDERLYVGMLESRVAGSSRLRLPARGAASMLRSGRPGAHRCGSPRRAAPIYPTIWFSPPNSSRFRKST